MTHLHITQLRCDNRQDTINQDTVVFQVAGTTISGPHSNMSAGDTRNLNTVHTFTGNVTVTLLELDTTSADDVLGVESISAALAGQGTQTAHCHLPNATYHWEYYVD